MRLIVGLDRPTGGDATIGGVHYADLPRPLRVVGALLDAGAAHKGRSAYDHLLYLSQTQGIARRRVDEVLDLVGLHDVAHERAGSFSLAISVGAIVRHAAGGIAGIIAFVLVLAPLTQLIPGSTGDHVFAYLPTSAGQLMVNARQGPDDLLTPWQGFGVMCLWTVALMLLANYLLWRRDA